MTSIETLRNIKLNKERHSVDIKGRTRTVSRVEKGKSYLQHINATTRKHRFCVLTESDNTERIYYYNISVIKCEKNIFIKTKINRLYICTSYLYFPFITATIQIAIHFLH